MKKNKVKSSKEPACLGQADADRLMTIIDKLHAFITFNATTEQLEEEGMPYDIFELFIDNPSLRKMYSEHRDRLHEKENAARISALRKLTKEEIEMLEVPEHIIDRVTSDELHTVLLNERSKSPTRTHGSKKN